MEKVKAYKEILEVLNKHAKLIDTDYSIDITQQIKDRITIQEISKEFEIEIKPDCNPNWCKLSEYRHITLMGGEHNRTIAWCDDGSQPDNERLYKIGFPTGAYIFGESCPVETFAMFFSELKSYTPKYVDSANKCLYFTSLNAKYIHKDFDNILEKHRKLVGEELKAKKIASLKEDLEKLTKKED